jgi:hypothetical protein
LYIAAE